MSEKFWIWLAWKLPKDLVYWCAVRVASHATTTAGVEEPDRVGIIQMLKRWELTEPEPSDGAKVIR